jgi:uncharacterized membrane protein (Fun14 family)
LALLDELLQWITSGSIIGLPPIAIMIIPLVLGLIAGFFIKKFLKIAIIATIIILIASYLDLFNLSLDSLKDLEAKYGPAVIHYAVLLIGMLPLSIGFVIGLILGFIFG